MNHSLAKLVVIFSFVLELQVRTAEFIKMRAEHSHLFTGDKNLANKAWG